MIKEINMSILDTITALYIESFNSAPWNDKWTTETASARLRQMINCSGFLGLYMEQEEKVIGLILGNEEVFYNANRFQIKEFCIHPQYRGQKLGAKLLMELESRLVQKGIDELFLYTGRIEQIVNFYHKSGFKDWDNMVLMGKPIS